MSFRRSKVPKFIPIISLLILLVLGPIVFSFLQNASGVEAAWVDDNFSYRNAIPITSHTAAENNVYVTATIDTSASGQFQSDCGDLRFTTVGGDILPYYIVSGCVSASTVVHVFFKSMPAGAQTLYYYYGNPSAANGFSSADFATQATAYAIGSVGSQEKGGAPIAYWKFDEGTGTNAQDSSPNNNDGTITGSTWQTEDQCISGKCLFFDGSTSNVAAANLANTTFPSSGTISFWSNSSRWSATDNLFGSQTGASNVNSIRLEWVTGNKYRPIFGNAAGSYDSMDSYTAAVTNAWTYITLTWDQNSSGTIKLYLNGKLDQSKTSMATYYPTVFPSFNIGRGYSGRYSKGFIDDFKIYNYARTAAQIKSDFKSRGTAKGVSVVAGSSRQNSDALSNGLIGYWKTDEATWSGTASEVIDASGNSNHGTAQGTVGGKAYPTGGKFGNGGFFDGVDDYVSAGNPSILNIGTGDFSISVWFKNTTNYSADRAYFVSKNRANCADYIFGLDLSEKLWFNVRAPSTCLGPSVTSTASYTDGVWHHAVATIKRNESTKLYVDGQQVGSDTSDTITLGSSDITDAANFYLGARNYAATAGLFNGNLDEVRIYNRALSPREVRDLYNWAPGPIGYWNFDDGSGLSAKDSSGNGNAFTLTTAKWIEGKFGKGFDNFNNADYGQIAQIALLNPTTPNLTVESWVYVKEYIDGATNHWQTIVEGSGNLNNANGYYLGFCGSGTNFCWRVGNGTNYDADIAIAQTNIPLNQWVHVAGTIDASNSYLYINGVKVATDPHTMTTIAYGAYPISFGTLAYALGSDHNLHGSIDEVRIYNYARTQKQIVEDMNAGHPVGGSPVGSQVGYWKFDEGYGTTTNNSGFGSNLNGTITGATWNNNGKFGKALNFDGSSDTVSLIGTSALNLVNNLTLSAWINPSTLSQASSPEIIAKSGGAYFYRMRFLDGGKVRFNTYGASDTVLESTATLVASTWTHIVMTYDGQNKKIYLNGKLDSSEATTGDMTSEAATTLNIGSLIGGSESFNGLIDEVKIYNSALTEDEIKLDYNRGQAMVLGNTGDASSSAGAIYCQPGSSDTCNPPVGEWNFNENGGASTFDTSGNGNTGTITGATWLATGKFGSALNFNGTSDFINLGSNSSLRPASAITYSAWIKLSQTPSSTVWVISEPNNASPWYDYSLQIQNTLSARCNVGVNFREVSFSLNEWTHITCVYDGTNVSVYKNGVFGSSNAATLSYNAPDNLYVGTWKGTDGFFKGFIDQVRIYNYARTAAQIALDYNQGKPIGWWKMDECQGASVFDASGNGNTGTITIGATGTQTAVGTCTTSGTAWYNGVTGKFNSSLNFDGTDDYVDLGDPSADDVTGAITLSAWIKPTTVTGSSQKIVGNENSAWCGYPCGGYSLYITSGGYLNFTFGDNATGGNTGNWDVVVSDTVLTAGSWQHVVGIWDGTTGSNGMKVYVNGILKGQATAVQTRIDHGTPNTVIGAENDSAGTWRNYFSGQIDDVRIYNYVLTPLQVKTLYNGSSAIRFGPQTGSP